ncbi:hypothetical protein THAOC_10763, partial [Thalassiosira oceanica]
RKGNAAFIARNGCLLLSVAQSEQKDVASWLQGRLREPLAGQHLGQQGRDELPPPVEGASTVKDDLSGKECSSCSAVIQCREGLETPPPLTSMSASAAFDAANDRVGKHPPDKDESFAEAASHDGHQEEASGKDESASDSEDDTNSGVYCGEYDRNGLPHGQGTKDYSNGDKFVGIWHHGRRKSGTLHYNDGNLGRKFVGDFDLNEDRVKGKVVFPSGSVFEGEFAEDRIVFGKFKYVDKSGGEEFYQGSFKGGHRNGHGTYIFENGSV